MLALAAPQVPTSALRVAGAVAPRRLSEDCAAMDCPAQWIDDGACDATCNVEECRYSIHLPVVSKPHILDRPVASGACARARAAAGDRQATSRS